MAAGMQPCGTQASAKRHRRLGEPMDEACLQAERDEKNGRVDARRAESAQAARAAMPEPSDGVDRDVVLHEVLRTLRGQLAEAPPQSVASIAKQIRDTLDAMGAESVGGERSASAGLSDIAKAYREKRKTVG